ncbi:hypothetical protein T261_2220 [Streptomyces lydicus]|nr:hypothetical protein T261_2220 [Streptomyces lydicus]
MHHARQDYLKYLACTREQVRDTARSQRLAECRTFPDPGQLWALIAERKGLWERRPGDDDFAQVRVGLGPQTLATRLVVPQAEPAEEWEPLSAHALRRFVESYEYLEGLSLAVSLRAFPRLTIRGDTDAVQRTARAVVCQLAALHSPDDLWIAVVTSPGAVPEWDWIKWLPHSRPTQHASAGGRGDSRLLVYSLLGDLEEDLASAFHALRASRLPDPTPVPSRKDPCEGNTDGRRGVLGTPREGASSGGSGGGASLGH